MLTPLDYLRPFNLPSRLQKQGWKERWTVPSTWKSASELGEWSHTAGQFNGGSADDKAIQTSQDARFYGLSAPLSKPFKSSTDKDLVIQYTVKHEQKIDCGGAYIKLLPGGKSFDAAAFGGDTPCEHSIRIIFALSPTFTPS